MTIIKVSRKKYNQHFITHTVERKQIKAKPSYLSATRRLMTTLSAYFTEYFSSSINFSKPQRLVTRQRSGVLRLLFSTHRVE